MSNAAAAGAPDFQTYDLIPAIVQDATSGQVLMLGYMNQESYARTLADGEVWFWSRSRGRLWRKGESSGNVLKLRALRIDCDADTILVLADPAGPTCHTGEVSCFFTSVHEAEGAPPSSEVAAELFATIQQRLRDRPDGSYIAKLAARGIERMAQKVGEEATEVVIASVTHNRADLINETADLWFHTFVLLAESGLTPDDIWKALAQRRR
ncbi:MAG: bifunctional phosphoribosyl-AMP cyclohydrolase/phosphoribosyl-ATP diphosphatase HisIE [Chloroflexi bacterium]|nr:bifunctional phosphoribosyl-AMP cyclohydrolase/phosphoribosyl-ATP diphosphatase HisIE [Chloroflexota bacterium]